MPRFAYIPVPEEHHQEIVAFVESFDGNGFKVVSAAELPESIPDGLRQKFDSAVVVVSGSADSRVFAVWNNLRYDERPGEIDQHPYAVVLVSGSLYPTASLVEHGDWAGRTTPAPPDFVNHVIASGIGDYFLSCPPTGQMSGSLDQLGCGMREAFDAGVRALEIRLAD